MDQDFQIDVEISREPNYEAPDNQYYENDEIGDWTGEPSLPGKQEPSTPVVEIQTSERWLIVRVPPHVRAVDELAYSPKILSIGPLHHDEPSLKAMEAHKLRFLDRLIDKVAGQNIVLGDIESAMMNLEQEARRCYSEEFDHINRNDFVRMLILDACFIIEFLRLYEKAYKHIEDVKEPIFGTRWMLPIIGRDLLMLENQLPMFVLQKLYDLTNVGDTDPTPLDKLALQFFETLRPFKDKLPSENVNKIEISDIPHLLGLFQSSFILSNVEKRKLNDYERLPGKGWVNNATRLKFAGIIFRPQSDDKLLTVEFEKPVLKIPTLLFDDGTSPLFRNLIAHEHSNRKATPFFTSLAVFLDSIVDTQKDVDILRNAGIIKQAKGGNNEILNLLNSLTRELEFDMEEYCYMSKQIEDVNNFCRSFKASMLIDFRTSPLFQSPMAVLSFLLSISSFLQFVIFLLGPPSSDQNNAPAPAPAPAPSAN